MADKSQRCEVGNCDWTSGTLYEHCHWHGWVRGMTCQQCNTRMSFVDKIAHGIYRGSRSLIDVENDLIIHWMKCPDCAVMAFTALAGSIEEVRRKIIRSRVMRFDVPVETPAGLCDGNGDAA